MEKIGIFYTTLKGRTEYIGKLIKKEVEEQNKIMCDIYNIHDKYKNMKEYELIILLTPTYGAGALPKEWNKVLEYLESENIKGKKFALCGTGNGGFYAATFVNGLRDLYDFLKDKDAKIIGETDRNDYEYVKSRSEVNGKFIGLAVDLMFSEEVIKKNIDKWIKNIIKE